MTLMKKLIKMLKNYKLILLFLLKHYLEAMQTSLIEKSHLWTTHFGTRHTVLL